MYTHLYIHLFTYICMYTYTYMYTHIQIHIRICICIYIYVCIDKCLIYIYIYMYIFTYYIHQIYTHIYSYTFLYKYLCRLVSGFRESKTPSPAGLAGPCPSLPSVCLGPWRCSLWARRPREVSEGLRALGALRLRIWGQRKVPESLLKGHKYGRFRAGTRCLEAFGTW